MSRLGRERLFREIRDIGCLKVANYPHGLFRISHIYCGHKYRWKKHPAADLRWVEIDFACSAQLCSVMTVWQNGLSSWCIIRIKLMESTLTYAFKKKIIFLCNVEQLIVA